MGLSASGITKMAIGLDRVYPHLQRWGKDQSAPSSIWVICNLGNLQSARNLRNLRRLQPAPSATCAVCNLRNLQSAKNLRNLRNQ